MTEKDGYIYLAQKMRSEYIKGEINAQSRNKNNANTYRVKAGSNPAGSRLIKERRVYGICHPCNSDWDKLILSIIRAVTLDDIL